MLKTKCKCKPPQITMETPIKTKNEHLLIWYIKANFHSNWDLNVNYFTIQHYLHLIYNIIIQI